MMLWWLSWVMKSLTPAHFNVPSVKLGGHMSCKVRKTSLLHTITHKDESFHFDSLAPGEGESTFWLESVAITHQRFVICQWHQCTGLARQAVQRPALSADEP
jgi:hypothetical protein